jgi:hypothetical protein
VLCSLWSDFIACEVQCGECLCEVMDECGIGGYS